MNEIFSNELSELSLTITVRGEEAVPLALPTARLWVSNTKSFDGPGEDLTVIVDGDSSNNFKIPVPYNAVKGKRFAKVTYTYELPAYGVVNHDESFEIRTRLLTFDEYRRMMDDPDIEFVRFNVAETESRRVIESYCGQVFSRWTGSREVTGSKNRFFLPQYMSKITAVSQVGDEDSFFESYLYKLEPSGLIAYREGASGKSDILNMVVSGEWGYEVIPSAIKTACYELTRSFTSTSISDRRKFLLNSGGGGLTGMEEAADFISWKAYADSTGNPIADQLLAPFRIITPGFVI